MLAFQNGVRMVSLSLGLCKYAGRSLHGCTPIVIVCVFAVATPRLPRCLMALKDSS